MRLAKQLVVALMSLTIMGTATGEAWSKNKSSSGTDTDNNPATMQRITLRYVADDIDPDSFAAQPRTCYRAGNLFGRIEEAPDKKLGLHGLIVIKCPDVWMVNLIDNSGKHIIDRSPPSTVHLPIISSGPKLYKTLEFGRELEFFRSNGATPNAGPVIDKQKTTAYKYGDDLVETELLVDDKDKPLRLIITSPNGKRTLEYLAYETVPFSAQKFERPDNIAFAEIDPVERAVGSLAGDTSSSASNRKVLAAKSSARGQSAGRNSEQLESVPEEPVVEPTAPLTAINSSKDLWQWMTYYYLFPAPELTTTAINMLEKDGAFDKESALAPASSFLSRIFAAHPDKAHKWASEVSLTDEHKKALLPISLRLARTPEAISEAEEIEKTIPEKDRVVTHIDLSPDKLDTFYISSPSDLDRLWGCFLATGDKRYIHKIISTIPWSKKMTGSLNKISIGAAAVWSLTSNAQQHKRVLQILKEESESQPELKDDLVKIIEKAEQAKS
jgi:hypothetical protein